MNRGWRASIVFVAFALALQGCASKPSKYLADAERRKAAIEVLVNDSAMRQEVIGRLVGSPNERAVVIERILSDEEVMASLVAKILEQDRGKALVVHKVSTDPNWKTFVRMLMLTGVMGEAMTQRQAAALGLGEAFAFGNQRRTMLDLKKIGSLVDAWAKEREGQYPVCSDWADVSACLAKRLPGDGMTSLRLKDAWGHAYQYRSDREGTQYILVSYSTDGQYDGLGKVGPTDSFDCDIVFSNGDFVQWPGWIRKEEFR